MIDGYRNEILPDELCLKYTAYWQTWSRVLFMNTSKGDRWVEVNLTPPNPSKHRSWEEKVMPLVVRFHRTRMDTTVRHFTKDTLFRAVMRNKHSLIYNNVKQMMLREVPVEIVHRLMCDDFLNQIDWERFVVHDNGGCPFALCKVKS